MPFRITAALALLVVFSVPAAAQCEGRWLEGPEFERAGLGTNAQIRAAVEWDPDGEGPEPFRLVVGGTYGPYQVPFLAMWDGAAFRPFGSFPVFYEAQVRALAVYRDRLFVGMFHPSAASPFIYEWDGATLQARSTGTGSVLSMTVAHDSLYVGGYFHSLGGVAANGIARWNGTAWAGVNANAYGTLALITTANGDVVAGGNWGVARYNGTAWTTLASSVDSRVRSLIELPDGGIVAGGLFTSIAGVAATNIAHWDGSAWRPMGSGSSAPVRGMAIRDGRLVACMAMRDIPSGQAFQLGTWSLGGGWSPLAGEIFGAAGVPQSDDYGPYVIRPLGAQVFVGGGFDRAGSLSAQRVAFLEGDQWVPFGSHFDGSVSEFLARDGSLVAAGSFTRTPGGVSANGIARWDGTAWSPLGDGLDGPVSDIEPLGDDLLASGTFSASGATPTGPIARWDGESWQPFGDMDPAIKGELAAVGSRIYVLVGGLGGTLRYWDDETSTAWGTVPTPTVPCGMFYETARVNDLAAHSGSLYIGGWYFDCVSASQHGVLMRLTGDSWVVELDRFSGRTQPYSVYRLWSIPAHGLVFTGLGFGASAFWDGLPLPFPAFWQSAGIGADLTAVASNSSGHYAANGWFRWANSGTAINQIAYTQGGLWQRMGEGRAVGSSLAYFGNELVLNAGDPSTYSDISAVWSRWSFGNTPWLAQQPSAADGACGQPVTFTIVPASGYDPLTFRWQLQDPIDPSGWRDLADGPLMIAGREVADIADSATPALTVTPRLAFSPPVFRAVIANACGSAASEPATLAITGCPAICDADVNCDGALNGFDIEAMQQAVAGDLSNFCLPSADFNNDGAENGFDVEAVEQAVNGVPCP